MNHFSDLQNDLYDKAVLYPCGCTEGQACVQNSFLLGRGRQQLSAAAPQRGAHRVEPTSEQMVSVLRCSLLSWGSLSEVRKAVTGRDSSGSCLLCLIE